MFDQRKIKENIARLVVGQGLITLIALVSSIVIARFLSVEDRGILTAVVILSSSLVAFSEFGIVQTTTKFVSQNSNESRNILNQGVLFNFLRVIFIVPILFVLYHKLSLSADADIHFTLKVIGIIVIVPLIFTGTLLGLILARDDTKFYNTILIQTAAANAILVVLLWSLGKLEVLSILISELLVNLLILFQIVLYLKRRVGFEFKVKLFSMRQKIYFGLSVYISNIITFINSKLVYFFILKYFDLYSLGLFSIAQSASERLYLISDGFSTYIFPLVSSQNKKSIGSDIYKIISINLFINVTIVLVLWIFAKFLILFLFGFKYVESVGIFQVLLLNVIPFSAWRLIAQSLNGLGHSFITAIINGFGLGVFILMSLMLYKISGLYGLAYSMLAQSTLMCIVALIFLASLTRRT